MRKLFQMLEGKRQEKRIFQDPTEAQNSNDVTCRINESDVLTMHICLKGLNLICLHPICFTPFCYFSLPKASCNLIKKVDHTEISLFLGTLTTSDLTNYPITQFPLNCSGLENKNLLATFTTFDDDPTVEIFLYNEECPLKKKNILTKVNVKVKEAHVDIIGELTLQRDILYIVEHISNPFIPEYFVLASDYFRKTEKAVPGNYEVECLIELIKAEIKPRQFYEKGFLLIAEEVFVGNTTIPEDNQIIYNKTEILGRKLDFLFDNRSISDPFDLNLDVSVFPKETNKGIVISGYSKVPIKLLLDPYYISQFIQFYSLNLFYQDGMKEIFKTPNKQVANEGVFVDIIISFPSVIISLNDWTNDWLFELQLTEVKIANTLFYNSNSKLEISAGKLSAFDRNMESERVAMIFSKEEIFNKTRKNSFI